MVKCVKWQCTSESNKKVEQQGGNLNWLTHLSLSTTSFLLSPPVMAAASVCMPEPAADWPIHAPWSFWQTQANTLHTRGMPAEVIYEHFEVSFQPSEPADRISNMDLPDPWQEGRAQRKKLHRLPRQSTKKLYIRLNWIRKTHQNKNTRLHMHELDHPRLLNINQAQLPCQGKAGEEWLNSKTQVVL